MERYIRERLLTKTYNGKLASKVHMFSIGYEQAVCGQPQTNKHPVVVQGRVTCKKCLAWADKVKWW